MCRLIFERTSHHKNGAITFLGHVFHYWFCITYSITGIRVWTWYINYKILNLKGFKRATYGLNNCQLSKRQLHKFKLAERKLKLIYISTREDNWIRDIQFFNWPFDLKNKTGMYYQEV